MIKKIAIRGMKSHEEYSVELPQGKLLLIGPNGSGKSAVLDAVRFAILGYIPALGKRPSDTALVMSGSEMVVTLTLDDDRSIRRSLKRTGKKIGGTIEASWLRNAKPSQHHDEVLSLFGSTELDVEEILDIRTLLHETPVKRSGRIEEMIGGSGPDSEELIDRVGEQTVRRLYDGETDAEWRDLLKSLPTDQRIELKDLQGYLQSVLKDEDGIRAGIDWARKEKNTAHQRISDGVKAAREIETRLESMPEADGNLADLRDERDRLQREYGEERARVLMHNERRDEADILDETIESMKKMRLGEVTFEHLEEELVRIKEKYDELVIPSREEIDKAYQVMAIAEKDYRKLQGDADRLKTEYTQKWDTAKAKVEILELRLTSAKSNDWQTVYTLAGLAAGKTKKDSAGMFKIVKIASRNIDDPLGEIETDFADARLTLGNIASPPNDTALIENARLVFVAAEERHLHADNAVRDLLEKYNRDERSMSGRMKEIRENLDQVKHARERLATAKARREALGEVPEYIADNRDFIQLSIDEITVKIGEVDKRVSVKSEMKSILEDVEKRRARWTCLSAILWAMERVREGMVNDAGDSLTKAIDSFLEAAGRPEKSHLEAAKGKCEIGWTNEGRTVLVESMSGGEWQVFTTAFASAMLALRAPEVPVLLVEMGECDTVSKCRLIDGLVDVQATIIVATHSGSIEESGTDPQIVFHNMGAVHAI